MPKKIIKEKKVEKIEAAGALPKQDKFFSTGNLKKSARSGTQLPDPTHAPYGYDANAQFRHLFPALELPVLKPPAKYHAEDNVSFGSPELPPHELYLGDNLYLLRQLPSDSIDLIYIDPPFFSNRTYTQIWGDDNEVRSFNDIFQDGMFSYLAWLNARLFEMKRVLKPTGSIYVHCDWHASHYIKTEMDKLFGYDNFRNEIIWNYGHLATLPKKEFPKKHDLILLYSKTKDYKYFPEIIPSKKDIKKNYPLVDEEGNNFRWVTLIDKDGKPYKKKRVASRIDAGGVPVSNVWDINEIALGGGSKMAREELIRLIIDDVANEPHQALIGAFRQETAEQLHKLTNALEWIIKEKFGVEGIDKIDKAEDGTLAKMYFCLPQIFEEFRNPALILGILGEK